MSKTILTVLSTVAVLSCLTGCQATEQAGLTVLGGDPVIYTADDGSQITARYYTLSDSSLHFVKVLLPDGQAYTLPQSVSGSGARYTDDMMLTWWIKGDSASVEMRDDDGQWQTIYAHCHVENE
jgi:membrane-bound inhibitor of C-type lysozyme